jgi:hypothetical protein
MPKERGEMFFLKAWFPIKGKREEPHLIQLMKMMSFIGGLGCKVTLY